MGQLADFSLVFTRMKQPHSLHCNVGLNSLGQDLQMSKRVLWSVSFLFSEVIRRRLLRRFPATPRDIVQI